jgi:hypothetical protein
VIPAADTILIVEDELRGARHWAHRRQVAIDWLPDLLEVRVTLTQPETKELFFLRGLFDDYRAIAPAWTYTDHGWKAAPHTQFFPKVTSSPHGNGMIVVQKGIPVICAPFNRLAYAEQSGPHGDWGGPSNWLSAGGAYVHAETIADMLQAIRRDFLHTRGRMAPA